MPPKRINFIAIQNSQLVHADGYTPLPCRTGYERVMAHRTDDLFAKTADQDGMVEKLTDDVITIKNKDGTSTSYEIGRRFGRMGGETIPHDVKTDLKVGDRIRQGDNIVYNTKYFTKDTLDPTQVIYKPGVLARTALMESTDTYEDSSAISQDFAKKLATQLTSVRTVKVAFEQEVHNLLPVGTEVDTESILCTIQNASEGNKDLFDEQALATLKAISSLAPKAKASGVIEKIEVLYTGELEDMSPSIRALVEASDKTIIRKYKQMGREAVTGQVDPGFRIDGVKMEMDSCAIRVFITGPVPMGVGDKGVFALQLKTVVARVMVGENTTEDGKPIDAIFGYQSISDRIALSPELTGTTNTLLLEVTRLMVEAYKGKAK